MTDPTVEDHMRQAIGIITVLSLRERERSIPFLEQKAQTSIVRIVYLLIAHGTCTLLPTRQYLTYESTLEKHQYLNCLHFGIVTVSMETKSTTKRDSSSISIWKVFSYTHPFSRETVVFYRHLPN